MSIYRRKSGRYQVLIDVDRAVDGRRRRRPLGTFATRKEAERAEREALGALDRGVDLIPRTVTVGQVVRRFLDDRATRCGAKTQQEYEAISGRYIVPKLGTVTLAKLRAAHIAEWQAALATSGGRNDGPLSAKTVSHARSLLHSSFSWAVRMGLAIMNPCSAVEAPRVRRSEAKALSTDEIVRIIRAATGTRWEAFVVLAFAVGARRGELLALQWADVDFEARSLAINASLSQTTAGGIAMKDTKSGRSRSVPLAPVAIEALRRAKALQARDRLAAGGAYQDDGYIFADAVGVRTSPMAATNAYARLARKAAISSTRLHDARHTAATTLLTAGVDVRTTAGILGHASPVVTLTTYAHLLDEAQRAGVERLGAAVEQAAERAKKA